MRFKNQENARSHSNDSSNTGRGPKYFGGVDDHSNYASTTDISLILDEREKRLQTKEELIKVKE
jgi:hypothetical protein